MLTLQVGLVKKVKLRFSVSESEVAGPCTCNQATCAECVRRRIVAVGRWRNRHCDSGAHKRHVGRLQRLGQRRASKRNSAVQFRTVHGGRAEGTVTTDADADAGADLQGGGGAQREQESDDNQRGCRLSDYVTRGLHSNLLGALFACSMTRPPGVLC